MFGFLEQICPDFSELPFLLGRNNWARLVQTVGDQVVQLLPVIQLKRYQTQLGFNRFVSHRGPVADNSRVSSIFCKLSISRCAHGRSTVCTWLMIPSSI